MEISFEKINKDLEKIIKNFDDLLYQNKYNEAMDVLRSIHVIAERTYGIQLDEKEGYDHIFYETYTKLAEKVKDKEPDPEKVNEHLALLEYLRVISEDVFKTAEIRKKAIETKKDRQAFIEDYQRGIEDSTKQIKKLNELFKEYSGIKKEIFGLDSPNLKESIENGEYNFQKLKDIEIKLDKISNLKGAIQTLYASNDPDKDKMIQNLQGQIEELYSAIGYTVQELEKRGLNISTIQNIDDAKAMNIADAKTRVQNLQPDISNKLTLYYTELAKRIKDVKNKYPDIMAFASIDESKLDPSTPEGKEAIKAAYKPFEKEFKRINTEIKVQQGCIETWQEDMHRLEEEQKIAEVDLEDEAKFREGIDESTRAKIEEEKRIAHENNRDSFYGNEEKTQKYKEYFAILQEHIKEVPFTYIDSSGKQIQGMHKTVVDADTPQMQEVLKFLNLEHYKEKLERITKYDAIYKTSQKDAIRVYFDELQRDPEAIKLMEKAAKERNKY